MWAQLTLAPVGGRPLPARGGLPHQPPSRHPLPPRRPLQGEGRGRGGVTTALLRTHPHLPLVSPPVQRAKSPGETHEKPQPGQTTPMPDVWPQLHPVWQPECAHEDSARGCGAGGEGTSRGPPRHRQAPQVLHLQQALHHIQQHVPAHPGNIQNIILLFKSSSTNLIFKLLIICAGGPQHA